MKTSKKPDKESFEMYAKLDRCFPKNEHKWGITSTTLTLIEALGDEIMEAFEPHQLSPKARYAIIQYGRFRRLLSAILNDEPPTDEHKKTLAVYMPKVEWQNDDDWEEKFIFIVKESYKELEKEGKV